jgi:hypothetical protein
MSNSNIDWKKMYDSGIDIDIKNIIFVDSEIPSFAIINPPSTVPAFNCDICGSSITGCRWKFKTMDLCKNCYDHNNHKNARKFKYNEMTNKERLAYIKHIESDNDGISFNKQELNSLNRLADYHRGLLTKIEMPIISDPDYWKTKIHRLRTNYEEN